MLKLYCEIDKEKLRKALSAEFGIYSSQRVVFFDKLSFISWNRMAFAIRAPCVTSGSLFDVSRSTKLTTFANWTNSFNLKLNEIIMKR